MYQVVYKKRATKTLARMPSVDRQRILGVLGELARDPYAATLDTKRLQGRDGFRLRVGDWRVLYELVDARLVIQVLQIGSRGDVYK
jgi:mRNA interferase RelE/StbE